MRKHVFAYLLVFTFVSSYSQQLPLVTELDNAISESSGLIYINNTLITHNDSGGANELYEVNTDTGAIVRTVTITNATNIDWEDIAADDNYIYIADFGNNSGSRTDLKVYKVLINDFFDFDAVTAEIINFSYKDQTDFTPNPGPFFTTDYDAEALISYQGNLYIFTKQWTSLNSNVYGLPTAPGTYEIDVIDTISANGLVTGATTNLDNSAVLLSGYSTILNPFIIELEGFSGGLFSNGTTLKISVSAPNSYSNQIEAITPYGHSDFYLSSERLLATNPGLYDYVSTSLSTDSFVDEKGLFYPNPTSNWIYFKTPMSSTEIYNVSGQLLIKKMDCSELDLSLLRNGMYLIVLSDSTSGLRTSQKLFVY